jgi:hypothetical protein
MGLFPSWGFSPVHVFDGAGFEESLAAKFFGNILVNANRKAGANFVLVNFDGRSTAFVVDVANDSGKLTLPVNDAHWFEDGANLLLSGDEEEGRNLIQVGFEVCKVLS